MRIIGFGSQLESSVSRNIAKPIGNGQFNHPYPYELLRLLRFSNKIAGIEELRRYFHLPLATGSKLANIAGI